MRVFAVLTVVALTASVASGSAADRTVTSPGRVVALARSGYSVAFLSGPYAGHCGPQVSIWSLVSGGVYRLGRHTDAACREGPSTGSGVTRIAVAGTRALWLAYTGGNIREWSLYTATTTRPIERRLEFQPVDVDLPSPIVLGVASEDVLPYSVRSAVKALAPDGHRRYTWQAPGLVTNTTAYQGQVAVFVKGGKCFVLSPSGSVAQTYSFRPGTVQELALAGVGLVVQLRGGRVEIHRGASVRTIALPAAARMLDYAQGIILYRLGSRVRARRVADGKDASLRTAPLAVLEHNGLSYAVGRRVASVAMVRVEAAFGG